jgi:hypothetical protein
VLLTLYFKFINCSELYNWSDWLQLCYIPDSSWTPLRPKPIPEPIHTSGHIMFHAWQHVQARLRYLLDLNPFRACSDTLDSELLPDNSSQNTLSLPSSYSLYDTLLYLPFHYHEITDYLPYPLPIPYDTLSNQHLSPWCRESGCAG